MKPLFFIIFFAFNTTLAASKTITALTPSKSLPLTVKSKLIIDALKEEVGWPAQEVTIAPVEKKVETKLRVKSKGQNAIDKIREKNRALLKKQLGDKFAKQSGADFVRKQMQANRDKINTAYSDQNSPEVAEKNKDFLKKLRIKNKDALKHWQNIIDETQKYWDGKKREFLTNLKYYKQNLVDFKKDSDITKSDLEKPLVKIVAKTFHIIPGSLDLPIRDQGRRPTCSAFAGIRAIETLLNSHNIERDFSEQYLYWSSKPSCRSTPCDEKGSWVRAGFNYSQNSLQLDIPAEENCPYQSTSKVGNETQLPLSKGCQRGTARIESFSSVKSLDEIYDAIKDNRPVVGAFKLSPNFYKNNGLITYAQSLKNSAMDGHSLGHAFLIIGHLKLPQPLKGEGKVCLIIANSWGEGWGKAGFSCITERWIKEYRAANAFMALQAVKI